MIHFSAPIVVYWLCDMNVRIYKYLLFHYLDISLFSLQTSEAMRGLPAGSRGASRGPTGSRRMSRAQRGQGGNWERWRGSRGKSGVEGLMRDARGDKGSWSLGLKGMRAVSRGSYGVRVDVSGTSWGQRNGEVWWVSWWLTRHKYTGCQLKKSVGQLVIDLKKKR